MHMEVLELSDENIHSAIVWWRVIPSNVPAELFLYIYSICLWQGWVSTIANLEYNLHLGIHYKPFDISTCYDMCTFTLMLLSNALRKNKIATLIFNLLNFSGIVIIFYLSFFTDSTTHIRSGTMLITYVFWGLCSSTKTL